ncbi:DUF3025 domain-containing protein [Alteromonas flava]|uniref:DUF3025 domain-containing protein n=1 Tax=Alteromonas flava TaxID=2048003 RepID=UPI001F0C6D40|nr:DUF3025 domain-containing protein [Alteromonas flava]
MQTTTKAQFSHDLRWGDFTAMATKGPYLAWLTNAFDLAELNVGGKTVASVLNTLANAQSTELNVEFVDQARLDNDPRYYEQIIAEEGVIPTREDSWHDFFNGLIWLQFPQTKHALNLWHMQDIVDYGVNPRTPRRNRITHFDECGLVLVSNSRQAEDILAALREHNWEYALYEQREAWGTHIVPLVFGHANLEMLLAPFPGLTAKWCQVTLETPLLQVISGAQTATVDSALLETLQSEDVLSKPRQLMPLPLLGIPGWASAQDEVFYQNREVFRPRRQERDQGSGEPVRK